jgi:hypothetical protein
MSKKKPGSNGSDIDVLTIPHPCALGGNCDKSFKILVNYDSCARGRIDAKECIRCGNIFDFEIIR